MKDANICLSCFFVIHNNAIHYIANKKTATFFTLYGMLVNDIIKNNKIKEYFIMLGKIKECMEKLRNYDSSTVGNAIELFDVRPRDKGFMGPEIESQTRRLKSVCGFAATAKYGTRAKPTEEQLENFFAYLEDIREMASPTLVVMEDVDDRIHGLFFGGS